VRETRRVRKTKGDEKPDSRSRTRPHPPEILNQSLTRQIRTCFRIPFVKSDCLPIQVERSEICFEKYLPTDRSSREFSLSALFAGPFLSFWCPSSSSYSSKGCASTVRGARTLRPTVRPTVRAERLRAALTRFPFLSGRLARTLGARRARSRPEKEQWRTCPRPMTRIPTLWPPGASAGSPPR
jgi:hypothetical protein